MTLNNYLQIIYISSQESKKALNLKIDTWANTTLTYIPYPNLDIEEARIKCFSLSRLDTYVHPTQINANITELDFANKIVSIGFGSHLSFVWFLYLETQPSLPNIVYCLISARKL